MFKKRKEPEHEEDESKLPKDASIRENESDLPEDASTREIYLSKVLSGIETNHRKKAKTFHNNTEQNLTSIFEDYRQKQLIEAQHKAAIEAKNKILIETQSNQSIAKTQLITINETEKNLFEKMKTGDPSSCHVGFGELLQNKKIHKDARDENGDDFLTTALKNKLIQMAITIIKNKAFNEADLERYAQLFVIKKLYQHKSVLIQILKDFFEKKGIDLSNLNSNENFVFSKPQLSQTQQQKYVIDLINSEDEIENNGGSNQLKSSIPTSNVSSNAAVKDKQNFPQNNISVNISNELIKAIKEANGPKIISLVRQGADASFKFSEGNNILHLAIQYQMPIDAFRVIFNKNSSLLIQKNALGFTPLYIAMREDKHNYFEFINNLSNEQLRQFLLAKNYSINCVMGYAVLDGKTGFVNGLINLISDRKLIEHIESIFTTNVITFQKQNYNAITCIAFSCDPKFTRDVLNKYPKLIEPIFQDLLKASSNDNQNFIKTILDNIEKNINEVINGRTLLHQAELNGAINAVTTIIKMGANFNTKDSNGRSALDIATSRGNNSIIKMLGGGEVKASTHQNIQKPDCKIPNQKQANEQVFSLNQLENTIFSTPINQTFNNSYNQQPSSNSIVNKAITPQANLLQQNNFNILNVPSGNSQFRSENYNNSNKINIINHSTNNQPKNTNNLTFLNKNTSGGRAQHTNTSVNQARPSSNNNNSQPNNEYKNLSNAPKSANAFTMSNQEIYQYQYRDMDFIGKILVAEYNKNRNENDQIIYASPLNIGQDLDGKITNIKQELQKFSNDLIQNKKIVGAFNCGGNHWIAYMLFKDQSDNQIKCIYKDSLGNKQQQLEQAFGQAFYELNSLDELYQNHLLILVEGNAEQKLRFEPIFGNKNFHINCGIFALKNILFLVEIEIEKLCFSLKNSGDSDTNIIQELKFFNPGEDQITYQQQIKKTKAEFADKYCHFLVQEATNGIIAKINVEKHSNEALALANILGIDANFVEICSAINKPTEYLYKIKYSQFRTEYLSSLVGYFNSINIYFENDEKSKLLLIKSHQIFLWLDSIERSSQHAALYELISENSDFKPETNISLTSKNQIVNDVITQIYGQQPFSNDIQTTKNLINNIIEDSINSATHLQPKLDDLSAWLQSTNSNSEVLTSNESVISNQPGENTTITGDILDILNLGANWL